MISETTAFITTLPDIPRMITALAQWLSCMVCVLTLRRRITGWKFAAAGAGFLVVQNVMDICSIFGNALDNAIECEKKIKDYDKRMIHINAFSEKNFLIIRFENYYEGDIQFEKGLPVTTKKQAAAHGYGLKSLRYTVHKYDGEVNIDTDDSWFSLRILIPLNIS